LKTSVEITLFSSVRGGGLRFYRRGFNRTSYLFEFVNLKFCVFVTACKSLIEKDFARFF
jgi:hypothetical protein